MPRGRLIVLEGAEGVGKTTQLRRLDEWLGALEVPHLCLREPGGTALGNDIRRILLDRSRHLGPRAEALLFMASRAQLMEELVLPAVGEGKVVVLDRFFLSTYAYQIAGRGLPGREIQWANALATHETVPDLTIVLRVPERERERRTTSRGEADRIELAGDEFHQRVERAFDSFLDPEWQAKHPESGMIVAVDGTGTEDEVFERVVSVLAERWPEAFSRPARVRR
ncbi:MAG TPA: dTMP kinase [Gemmatimonadaceae bacterium]|jgi:dTMP kinase|nr:dTMP kinase [Gemmatimonadaceae bacterium]